MGTRVGFLARRWWIRRLVAFAPVGEVLGKTRYAEGIRLCRGTPVSGTCPSEEVVVNRTVINKTVNITKTHVVNKTVINEGPQTAVIEKASGRKVQAVPVRELRTKEEAQVVAKHPTPTSTSEKAVQTPVRRQAEKALPASEPRPVAKPAITTAAPQPPATKTEVHQAAEQSRTATLDEEKRAQQEKARETESVKGQSVPAAVEAKPENKREIKPEANVESRPAAERPAATREPTEQREGKGDEKKD
jgi:hypothetical protein